MFYQEIIEVFIDKITKNRQFFFLYIQVRYKSYSLPNILSAIFSITSCRLQVFSSSEKL